jgi:hypothetical protein
VAGVMVRIVSGAAITEVDARAGTGVTMVSAQVEFFGSAQGKRLKFKGYVEL